MSYKLFGFFAISLIFLISCSKQNEVGMDTIAEAYVKLVLNIGLYDADYVDAYYGPEEWRPEENSAEADFPYESLKKDVTDLTKLLNKTDSKTLSGGEKLRFTSLAKQLTAVDAKIELLNGAKLTFDEESNVLYDAVAPSNSEEYFQNVVKELEAKLPGRGSITDRLTEFKKQFIIPKDRLDAVFQAAISEARKRTLKYIELPEDESFIVEYVTNKAWSGYNWYQGSSHSIIQLNTDLPMYIDRAIDLACHEGYPGHHVFNVLLEKNLVRSRGWTEFSVYPLFSPQSLIAEGSANYGIDVAFPGDERVEFERNVLFELAGLDADKADEYYKVLALTEKLGYASNEAARQYLDGKINAEEAAQWLTKYALSTPERAQKSISFMDKYRSYVINYNLGQTMVKDFIERNGGTADQPEKRWQLFSELLSEPHTPSGLK